MLKVLFLEGGMGGEGNDVHGGLVVVALTLRIVAGAAQAKARSLN